MRSQRWHRQSACAVCLFLLWITSCGSPPKTPVLAKDVTDFHTLYGENCAGCHGMNGKNGAAPSLADPLYLSFIPKDTLRHTIENGVTGTPMPAFGISNGGSLYPKQVDALVTGIETEWAKPVSLSGAALPPYNAAPGDGDITRGEQVFGSACSRCHGDQGKAGSITNPPFLTLVSDQSLRTSAVIGRPDFGMPDWRSKMPGHTLTDREIADVVSYLASLRPPSETPKGAQDDPGR